jgi:hypothetical protein
MSEQVSDMHPDHVASFFFLPSCLRAPETRYCCGDQTDCPESSTCDLEISKCICFDGLTGLDCDIRLVPDTATPTAFFSILLVAVMMCILSLFLVVV